MRVNRETAKRNRESVVDTASKLFREQGVDGVGIGPLMKQAGLTNGAFYKQFENKDALVLEAADYALKQNRAAWREALKAESSDPLVDFKKWYLSQDHINHRGLGCTYSTLGSEAPRRGKPFQDLFAEAVEKSLGILHDHAPMERSEELETLCGLVGALILSRAVGESDLRAEIIEAMTDAPAKPKG